MLRAGLRTIRKAYKKGDPEWGAADHAKLKTAIRQVATCFDYLHRGTTGKSLPVWGLPRQNHSRPEKGRWTPQRRLSPQADILKLSTLEKAASEIFRAHADTDADTGDRERDIAAAVSDEDVIDALSWLHGYYVNWA